MLIITGWKTEKKMLDFSSSGLPNPKVTSIQVDGELLCNAYEFVEWESDNDQMQLIICDHCGSIGCQSGGWVSFRRAGQDVFVIPLFREIFVTDDWPISVEQQSEYAPPYIIRKKGILLFEHETYNRFRCEFPLFPEFEKIPAMTYKEAVLVFQHEVPGRLLGDVYKSPNNTRRMNLILATSAGNASEISTQLCRLVDEGIINEETATISAPEPDDVLVTLYPDLPELPNWHVFWKGNTVGLYLSPMHKLHITQKTNHRRQTDKPLRLSPSC